MFLDDLCSSRSADCSSAPTVRTESRVLPESGNLSGAMASGLCSVVVLALCLNLAQYVSGEFDFLPLVVVFFCVSHVVVLLFTYLLRVLTVSVS